MMNPQPLFHHFHKLNQQLALLLLQVTSQETIHFKIESGLTALQLSTTDLFEVTSESHFTTSVSQLKHL